MREQFEKMPTDELLNIINLKSDKQYTYDEIYEARQIFAERLRKESGDLSEEPAPSQEPAFSCTLVQVEECSQDLSPAPQDELFEDEQVEEERKYFAPQIAYAIYAYGMLPVTILWTIIVIFSLVAIVLLSLSFSMNIHVFLMLSYAFYLAFAWYGILNYTSWGFVLNRAWILSRVFISAFKIYEGYLGTPETVFEVLRIVLCAWILFSFQQIQSEIEKSQ